jgi:hypothetical protein
MSTYAFVRLARLSLAIMAVAALVTTAAGAEPSLEAARLDHLSFPHPFGTDYLNLSLMPGELFPQVPQGGFRAFSVKDDLDTAAPADDAPVAETSEPIQLEIRPDADPEAVWEEFFATHQPSPAAVRDAVRRLEDDHKLDQNVRFNHILALINAALRHGQPQAWMYDAMAVVMQAQGRPAEEIERVVLSAVDFADTPGDLMYIGVYLAQLGQDDSKGILTRRALELFRQVAAVRPVWPEPYIHGLKAAQRLDDPEAIQWATLEILSRAWDNDQADVWQQGVRAAQALLERLKSEGRVEEADRFQTAMDEALARDCVVVVIWNGQADVDLVVEEPSGTVCSLRSPRTTAGGAMLGDTSSQIGQDGTEGYQEIYACPEAFSGTYRVLLNRVWGKVTGGKVKVGVCSHYGTDKERYVWKWIPLKDDQAVVVFDLKDGRRKEGLQEHQVAQAADVQMAVGRQILAQQLAGEVDPEAVASLVSSRQSQGNNPVLMGLPFQLAGAVGYQPVITTIQEGAGLSATAVISADRRYVRITPQPQFQGITEVNTFNMASGDTGTSSGGTGGMGYGGTGFGTTGMSGFGNMGMGMGYM